MSSKREKILQTAEEEFLLHGYDGTSIDSIVREVGGSKSTVYAHFPDKADLFAKVLSEVRRELDFSLPRHREGPGEGPEELLHLAVIELLSALYRERALHLMRLLMAESQRFPEVARQFWDEGPRLAISVLAERLKNIGGGERATHLFDALTGARYLQTLLGTVAPPDTAEFAGIAADAIASVLGRDQLDMNVTLDGRYKRG